LKRFIQLIDKRIIEKVLTKSGKDLIWDITIFNSYPHILTNIRALLILRDNYKRRGFFSIILSPSKLYISWIGRV